MNDNDSHHSGSGFTGYAGNVNGGPPSGSGNVESKTRPSSKGDTIPHSSSQVVSGRESFSKE